MNFWNLTGRLARVGVWLVVGIGIVLTASAQRAIQNLLRSLEQLDHFFDHDRRMVGAIPPAGHGLRVGHLQKRFTSLSTAGVNCGIAVMS